MIKVSYNRYEEVFRGETSVRNEHPQLTNNWLSRRIELSERDIRSTQARLDDAQRNGGSARECERLVDDVKDARERHAHAVKAKREFGEVWKQGHGYVDEDLWESRVKAREEAERQRAREAAELEPAKADRKADTRRETPPDRDPGVAAQHAPLVQPKTRKPDRKTPTPHVVSDVPVAPKAESNEEAQRPMAPDIAAEEPAPERRSYKGLKNTPPDEHKFKKGAPSPNPHGRPKGARNLRSVIRELASQTIKVSHNGRRKSVNVIAAAMQLQVQKALKGDTKAFGMVMPLLREFWNEEVEVKDGALSADEHALLKNLRRARKLLDNDDDDDGGGR